MKPEKPEKIKKPENPGNPKKPELFPERLSPREARPYSNGCFRKKIGVRVQAQGPRFKSLL